MSLYVLLFIQYFNCFFTMFDFVILSTWVKMSHLDSNEFTILMYISLMILAWKINTWLSFEEKLELWVTSLSDTPRLQYYDVQILEYRYISKLPMKNERIWSNVKETTSHLQNKLTKNIHLGVATSTRPPFSWKYKLNYLPF